MRTRMQDLMEQTGRLAERLGSAPAGGDGAHSGSSHRGLPEDLRREIVDVRSRLFEIGLYDPVLARFDSATVTQASNAEIAEQLSLVSNALRAPQEP